MTEPPLMIPRRADSVMVACPDSRPPAYQAVIGLARAGLLHTFLTAYYYRGEGPLTAVARALAPARYARLQRVLRRRHDPEIPAARVWSSPVYDMALGLENRLAGRRPRVRGRVVRWRYEQFDRKLASSLGRNAPRAALVFSDAGSEHALPRCRELGITSILSMVHGDVREERAVLEREAETAPDFFRIYLGDGTLDHDELDWLHDRRLRDLEHADRILVPSEHIANTLSTYGVDRSRVTVIPYAADTGRFRPDPARRHGAECTFLFAGGITQRKGIKYLLEAWRLVRRPGWRLQLVGGLPRDPGPLHAHLDDVELLGRVSHAEMPARMAAADVFVFPSLFEGSAVVTYEALASGLPSIVTPEAGSVVRDEQDGLIVPAGDVPRLALAMERLGLAPELRAAMAVSARQRSEQFDWPRYHSAIVDAARSAGA